MLQSDWLSCHGNGVAGNVAKGCLQNGDAFFFLRNFRGRFRNITRHSILEKTTRWTIAVSRL